MRFLMGLRCLSKKSFIHRFKMKWRMKLLNDQIQFYRISQADKAVQLLIPQGINRIQLGGLISRIKTKEDADSHGKA